jgi:hypothetical protein
MTTHGMQEAVEELWRQALRAYRQEGLRERLSEEWPGDRIVDELLAYEYPPTFQPGYVGPSYFASGRGIALMGQNPGEGRGPASIEMNRPYLAGLEAFTAGDIGFEDVNRLVASHMLRWRAFTGKGIFREGGWSGLSLLDPDVRPSIDDIAYVNAFPFKTVGDQPPWKNPWKTSLFRRHVWTTYVARLLERLAPTVIVPMGAWGRSVEAELRGLAGSPHVIRVQHPSARNPQDLQASWKPLSRYLQGPAGS